MPEGSSPELPPSVTEEVQEAPTVKQQESAISRIRRANTAAKVCIAVSALFAAGVIATDVYIATNLQQAPILRQEETKQQYTIEMNHFNKDSGSDAAVFGVAGGFGLTSGIVSLALLRSAAAFPPEKKVS